MPTNNTQSKATVGSVVFIVDRTVDPAVIIAVPALKGLSAVGGGKTSKIDKSNMDSKTHDEYAAGRIAPDEASGELILIKSIPGHQKLKSLQEACAGGLIDGVDVFVGDSGSDDEPTLEGVDDVLTPPMDTATPTPKWTRDGTIGRGYISQFSPKKTDNDIDRADFAIQWTGGSQWVVAGELSTEFH